MFKVSSFEEEIYHSMEQKLANNRLENKYSFDKLSKAADYLNAAAELFEKAGMRKEADDVLILLRKLAVQLSSRVLESDK
jgi:hypothetical protein